MMRRVVVSLATQCQLGFSNLPIPDQWAMESYIKVGRDSYEIHPRLAVTTCY